jgi:hypothetical protein
VSNGEDLLALIAFAAASSTSKDASPSSCTALSWEDEFGTREELEEIVMRVAESVQPDQPNQLSSRS